MSMGLYFPLLIVGVAYAGLSIYAGMVANRGDDERSEGLRDLAFGAALAAAAYTAILLVLAAIDTPSRFMDAITIIAVMCGFFALLLLVLYAIGQAVGRVTRRPGR
jgi:hypothetical protein